MVKSETKNKLKKYPLNQILYGPPGTGKTYETARIAVEIIEGKTYDNDDRDELMARYKEYVNNKQIEFVTFHQSYSYEDFVEGIKASTKDNNLTYEINDGIFKEMCLTASTKESGSTVSKINPKNIWKMSLGNIQKSEDEQIFIDCIDKGYIALGYGGSVDFSDCDNKDKIKAKYIKETGLNDLTSRSLAYIDRIVNVMSVGDIVVIGSGRDNFRAIAEVTGDYELNEDVTNGEYVQCRKVKWLKKLDGALPRELIADRILTQEPLYNAKNTINTEKLKKFLAGKLEKKNYVMIIDEINRGNVSKIFGELITLIEDSKRAGADDERSAILPYSKERLAVPDNIYIVGTMNTADRSLTSIDLALRRRFTFIGIPPKPELLNSVEVHGINMQQLLTSLNNRISALLDEDHCIGHSYFLPLKDAVNKENMLAEIFQYKVVPLLQEYFYGDWEQIKKVLNGQFISEVPLSIGNEGLTVYSVNNNDFDNPDLYKKLI